jgi:hypothetical protein
MQKFRKIPLGFLGYVGEFFSFWDIFKILNFFIFYNLKKILFEKKSEAKKLIRV